MNDVNGYVYLLQSASGYWKIGKTSNPQDRLKTFSVKLPFEVRYKHLMACYNMHKLEAELHVIFASKRVNGEWFALSAIDVQWLNRFSTQIEFEQHCNSINLEALSAARTDIAHAVKYLRLRLFLGTVGLLAVLPFQAGIQTPLALYSSIIGVFLLASLSVIWVIETLISEHRRLNQR